MKPEKPARYLITIQEIDGTIDDILDSSISLKHS
jgi:hypothetical protein